MIISPSTPGGRSTVGTGGGGASGVCVATGSGTPGATASPGTGALGMGLHCCVGDATLPESWGEGGAVTSGDIPALASRPAALSPPPRKSMSARNRRRDFFVLPGSLTGKPFVIERISPAWLRGLSFARVGGAVPRRRRYGESLGLSRWARAAAGDAPPHGRDPVRGFAFSRPDPARDLDPCSESAVVSALRQPPEVCPEPSDNWASTRRKVCWRSWDRVERGQRYPPRLVAGEHLRAGSSPGAPRRSDRRPEKACRPGSGAGTFYRGGCSWKIHSHLAFDAGCDGATFPSIAGGRAGGGGATAPGIAGGQVLAGLGVDSSPGVACGVGVKSGVGCCCCDGVPPSSSWALASRPAAVRPAPTKSISARKRRRDFWLSLISVLSALKAPARPSVPPH